MESWFFVSFNIIISDIFPENFIEILQLLQKILKLFQKMLRLSSSMLTVFINSFFQHFWHVRIEQMISVFSYDQPTLNNFIKHIS